MRHWYFCCCSDPASGVYRWESWGVTYSMCCWPASSWHSRHGSPITLMEVVLPQLRTSWPETLRQVVRVFSSIGVALVVYFFLSRFLGIDDVISLDRIARRLLGRR